MVRVTVSEAFKCGDHRGNPTFHVSSTATVEIAVNDSGFEGWVRPVGFRARGHHIRVPQEHQERSLVPVANEQIAGVAKIKVFDNEPTRF